MESGNSGSMSSSGEEDYDSRSESLPSFLNTSMPFGAIAAANSDQPPSSFLSTDQIGSSFLFGAPNALLHMSPHPPQSNSATDNPFLGFDLLRPGGASGGGGSGRSSFNFDDIHGGVASSSEQSNNNNVLGPGRGCGGGLSGRNVNPSSSPAPSHGDQNTNIPVRNPKKRTRASRRAPTTVLTTDTTNFRAMVQEFTGIPAPPFSGSSYSRRLDLYGGSGSGLRSGLDSLYPIRPSPQKIQIQPPSSSSQLNSNSTSQNVGVLNMPNTVLTFQSLMQSHSQGNMIMPHHRQVATNPHISDVYDEHGTSNDKYVISNSNTSQSNVNCKLLNYNSNALSGLENVGSRGEVDTSWICPSD